MVSPATLTAGTIALVAILFILSPSVLETIELNWLDLRFRARGPLTPSTAIVIAAIDEKSMTEEGRWPWPRSRIAALVDALSRDGARAIGFDVVFSGSEDDPRLALIKRMEQSVDQLQLGQAQSQLKNMLWEAREAADHDSMLARSLERSLAPVVLGYFFHMSEQSVGFALEAKEIEKRLESIAKSKYPLVYQDPRVPPPFIKAYAPQVSIAELTGAAASSGYFSVASDPDGVVRWMPLVIQGGEDYFPPLSLLCAWHYLGKPELAVRAGPYGIDGVQLGSRFIPTDEAGRLFVNYRGAAQTFPTYSVSDILARKLPEGTFKDRIVIVGATATALGDIRTTPYGPLYPGPEIHASVIDNILAGDFIERPRWAWIFDLSMIVALGGLVGITLPRVSAIAGLRFSIVLFVGYVLAAYILFVKARISLNLVYPILAIAATYTILTLYRYLSEERERRLIKEVFQHYTAPEVIEIIMANPTGLRLGGEERVVTALISDLAGFTSFSERRTPSEVITVLSEYYGEMTEEVFNVQGTLVEYVGDELFAIYGAPVAQADHAKRACESALAMQARRKALTAEWEKLGRPLIRARTGINTGNMLVGNIGSKYRFHYGAMGDPVNLASRLEGLNKIYGTQIIVSDNTAQQVTGLFRLRELDLVRVKGREQPLGIHELLGAIDVALPLEYEEMLSLYQMGLAAYRERRWDEAARMFERCLRRWPNDGPALLMQRRCRDYREKPPAGDWGGTFEDRRA